MPVYLTAIRPKKMPVYDPAAFAQAISDSLEETAQAIIADFEKTTSTWQHQPTFDVMRQRGGGYGVRFTELTVGTDDEIYGYVDQGTRRHLIRARNARTLAFAAGGTPKTRPNRLLAQAGAKGSTMVFRKQVMHPGTKARNFSKMIQRKHAQANTLGKKLQAHIDRLAAAGS